MNCALVPGVMPPGDAATPGWWFAFAGSKLLVETNLEINIETNGEKSRMPQPVSLAEIGLQPVRTQFLGTLNNQPCYSAELAIDAVIPKELALRGLRDLYGTLDEELFGINTVAP